MYPILFEIFGHQIASYGTSMVLGAVAAWFTVRLLARGGTSGAAWGAGGATWGVAYAFLICLCGAMAGAFLLRPVTRLPELFIYRESFRSQPVGVIMGFLFGEIVFYGGLIGGTLALLFYCRQYKLSPLPFADLFAPAVALGHAIGRVGCFLGGCCYGVRVSESHPFGVRFPPETAGGAAHGEPLLAVQLIEAACLLVITVLLAVVYVKAARKGTPGLTVCLYGVLYSTARFVLEFYRGDLIRGVYGPFSTSQYISIAVFCLCATLLIRMLITRIKHDKKVKCHKNVTEL